jgi:hypothetical protein
MTGSQKANNEEGTITFRYFAYGSNMLSCRLKAPNRAPSATVEGIGFVEGVRLTFDKVSCDGSGKCDMQATGIATDRVYGVLYSISKSERRQLDDAEGLGKGYRADENVKVCTKQGQYKGPILAYVADKKDSTLKPYHWYKALVIAGALEHGLPVKYVEWLRTTSSKPDLDQKRQAKEEALLFAG